LPVIRLVITSSPASLRSALADPDIRDALLISLQDAAITAVLATVLAVPLAYLLARRPFRGRALVQAVVDLPLAVPHTVAGIALLFVYGRTGWIGAPAGAAALSFYGTHAGIVVAMLFVSAPFAVNSARVAFEALDPHVERAARSLGATPAQAFLRVSVP
jgi:molybdate/tungstate transport system permease protein